MARRCEFSVVVPVYNSETTLEEFHIRLSKVLADVASSYEIIFVDDCSTDTSFSILKRIKDKDNKVKLMQFSKNFGQQKAVLCGLRNSCGKYVITMDDDLQHPPEEIPKLINSMKDDISCDVSIATRKRTGHGIIRDIGSSITNILNTVFFKKDLRLRMGSFRIMKRWVVDEISKTNSFYPVIGPLILNLTDRIKNIEVDHLKRSHGRSNYTKIKLIRIFLDNILFNSTTPLRLVSSFGIITSFSSIIYASYIVYLRLVNKTTVAGWTSIMAVSLFFFGFTLFILGVIGEYIIRLVNASTNQIPYVVREVKD